MKKLILKLIAVSAIIALPASSIIYDCVECSSKPAGGAGLPTGPGVYFPGDVDLPCTPEHPCVTTSSAIIGPVLEFPEPCGIQGQRPCRADVVTASTVPMAGLEQAGPPSIYDPLGECEAEHEGQSPCRNDLV